LFGLLTVNGMWVGEALALDRRDAVSTRLMTVHRAKGNKSRFVLLHPPRNERFSGGQTCAAKRARKHQVRAFSSASGECACSAAR
jgi:hypothetical protein